MVMDEGGPRPKTLTSDRGAYNENTRILRLNGHVRVDDSAASTLATNEAVVDTKAGTVSGVTPIAAASPTATIQAGHYAASEKGGHVTLTGGVHAVLKGR
jgi:lipopolysaccharide export system protein LptC